MQELVSLLPIIGIALLFWLLIIRPQSRRQKAVVSMQSALEPGAEVMLTSGIFGTLERVEDAVVWVTVADGITLRVAKAAVGNVVHPDDEHDDEHDDAPASDPVTEPVDDDPTHPPRDA